MGKKMKKVLFIISFSMAMFLQTSVFAKEANSVNVETPVHSFEMQVFDIVNAEREKNNMEPLEWNAYLYDTAATRAEEATENWSHTRPDGTPYYTVDDTHIYGENLEWIDMNAQYVANQIFLNWKASSTHYAKILESEYKTTGIAIRRENGRFYVAQEFGY